MKIHFFGPAPHSPSGYGVMFKNVLQRIKALGHDVSMTATYGVLGSPISFGNGIPILPMGKTDHSMDVVVADAKRLEADIVISNYDTWVFPPEEMAQVDWYPWMPIDHDPAPPAVIKALDAAKRCLVYSKHGVDALKREGIDAVYLPASVDTKVYKPMPQKEAREKLGMPEDKFIVGMVAANHEAPGRKAWEPQLRAFARFAAKHDDVLLYLHTNMSGFPNGVDLYHLVKALGIPTDRLMEVDPYRYNRGMLGTEYMVPMYCALDVLLNAARAEGFGRTPAEAQACGTPAIVTNFTAMPEVLKAGWLVGFVDKYWTEQNSYQVLPSSDDIYEALEQAYANRGNAELRQKAREAMVSEFDTDVVIERHWKPILTRIEAEREAAAQAAQPKIEVATKQQQERTEARLKLREAVQRTEKPGEPTPAEVKA